MVPMLSTIIANRAHCMGLWRAKETSINNVGKAGNLNTPIVYIITDISYYIEKWTKSNQTKEFDKISWNIFFDRMNQVFFSKMNWV